ncbi:MAG: GntR family transcriptional regulator [Pseudomonadaceae bacterium]|nr:GntR family transcriptional regulator [Pseudomonadaceae bacterium]
MQCVDKTNLSDDVADRIRGMITNGTLPAKSRINEVHLAEQLGISRTPLREALATLVAEGALENRPRKGNFVRPLTREEFESIYAIRPILDVEALRLSGIPDDENLQRLIELNEKLRHAKSLQARIARDDEWHLLLVQNCGNPILLDLIRQFILRTRRYENAYLQDMENSSTAYEEHLKVIRALQNGDLRSACNALKQNLTSGVAPILAWLDAFEGADNA